MHLRYLLITMWDNIKTNKTYFLVVSIFVNEISGILVFLVIVLVMFVVLYAP